MLFGIGIGRGALITAVHVLLLTTYYWSLSPIGLPAQPEWLDLERTWITGLPAHFGVYYMGYLGALWLWRRRTISALHGAPIRPLAGVGVAALAAATSVVIITGVIQTLLTQEFPGLTWFVMRIAVTTPFTIVWWMLAGIDRRSSIIGGIVLAFLLITYSHYLGPVGLPSAPARLLAGDSPPANVHWLSYREEFMEMLPLTAIVASIVYLLASRQLGGQHGAPLTRATTLWSIVTAAALVILGAVTAHDLGSEANQLTITSAGPGSIVADGKRSAASLGIANLRMVVSNRNTHRTPLPPHDKVDLTATIAADGKTYEIRASEAMVADPRGRFTTWGGVEFGKWHEGRSGIGLLQAPPIKSDAILFALGEVRSNGQLIATGVPLQVSATSAGTRRLDFQIGDPAVNRDPIAFHVSWSNFESGDAYRSKRARYIFGGGVLLIFLIIVFMRTRYQEVEFRANQQ